MYAATAQSCRSEKHVAGAVMAGVERPRIATLQVPHAVAEIGNRRFEEQVDMVGHQAERQAFPTPAEHGSPEHPKVDLPIGFVPE
jgi:hypothetical protein